MSPIVSYQYPDDFDSEALTNGGVSSPIASYVYCEWPGDENVTLVTSPMVSYFYHGESEVEPVVSNFRAAQRAGTQLVDLTYNLAGPDSVPLTVWVAVSTNGGASYALPATSFSGAVGDGVTPGTGKRITWDAGQDWPGQFSSNVRFRVTASDDTAPSGTALIDRSFEVPDMVPGGGNDHSHYRYNPVGAGWTFHWDSVLGAGDHGTPFRLELFAIGGGGRPSRLHPGFGKLH